MMRKRAAVVNKKFCRIQVMVIEELKCREAKLPTQMSQIVSNWPGLCLHRR